MQSSTVTRAIASPLLLRNNAEKVADYLASAGQKRKDEFWGLATRQASVRPVSGTLLRPIRLILSGPCCALAPVIYDAGPLVPVEMIHRRRTLRMRRLD